MNDHRELNKMSCKRSDITNLRGCRIGDVAIRGCGRGCCPYGDDKISENTRHHLLKTRSLQYRYSGMTFPPGRTGLNYVACQTSWRPKFICPKPICRRGIKPAYDLEKNDYRISEYGDWEVRPKPEQEPGLQAAFDNHARLRSRANEKTNEKGDLGEEYERFKKYEPCLWWRKVITIPRYYQLDEEHLMRCPSCGNGAMRVGSSFRIPKKTDEKAWKEIKDMIAAGEDMVAKFSVCSTLELHEEMVEEAQMIWAKKETDGPWIEEKKRRIEALGLKLKD